MTPAAATTPSDSATRTFAERRRALGFALLAALAYIPPLLSDVGKVRADTKNYLYLDIDRLLDRAPLLWDPHIGLGTVTHQNIGYLFPMGPFFWIFDRLSVPVWVAQRLWLGTLLFLAAAGVLFLLRTLHQRGPGTVVAAIVYMLSPYLLQYSSKHSIVALPWVALPWMIALVALALRDGGWKYPAVFAIVVQLVGSVNATAVLLVGIAPALWIPFAIWTEPGIDLRRGLTTAGRIFVLTLGASLWWIVALWVQGRYGIDTLRFTETVQTVSATSTAPDIFRGLGYWFFYGSDRIGLWNEASRQYSQNLLVIGTSFLLPVLGVLSAVVVRWRHRAYFVTILLIGLALGVGAFPYDDATPFGAVFKSLTEGSSLGLALRSSSRAVPMVVLGLALLLGVGCNTLAERLAGTRRSWLGLAVCAAIVVVAIANYPALWNGDFTTSAMLRPADIPKAWKQAIADVDARPHDTRILEIPGADFANYRWGGTVEPITPGLTDRPMVAREAVPWGSNPSADLVIALDQQLQDRTLEPEALPAVARLLAAGDILVRNDLEVDRYNLVRPDEMREMLHPRPAGLKRPKFFGKLEQKLTLPLDDARTLDLPPGKSVDDAIAVYHVGDAKHIVRVAGVDDGVLLSGNGAGIVSAASVGLIDGNGVVQYSGSYAGDPAALRRAATPGTTLVITDSNRRRAQRWTALTQIYGYTERAGEQPLDRDTFDARIEVFPGSGDDTKTVAEQRGAKVSASSYGRIDRYAPEDRPDRAFDGDLATAWRVAGFVDPIGERIRADFDRAITTDSVNLVQPLNGDRSRWITRATLRFDGGSPVTVDLGDASRTADGQTVSFHRRTFRRLEITIDDTNYGARKGLASAVGFAEVRVADGSPVNVDEVIRMPVDLVDALGKASADHRVVYVMTRERTPLDDGRISEEEPAMVRSFRVATPRAFDVRGRVRLASTASDDVLDRISGLLPAAAGGMTVTSSGRLAGSTKARASSAVDGDPSTAWTTPFGSAVGQWMEIALPGPVTSDHVALRFTDDGRHSVPTRLRIDAGGETRLVDVPASGASSPAETLDIAFPALRGDRFRVTIDATRDVSTIDADTKDSVVTPVAITELGLDGIPTATFPAQMPSVCRNDLVQIDGRAIPMRVDGTRDEAVAGRVLDLRRCSEQPIPLDAGDHDLRSTPGRLTGFDVDALTIASGEDGSALALGARGSVPSSTPVTRTPRLEVLEQGSTKMRLRVTGADSPFWLVLGESHNDGWRATIDDGTGRAPKLVDGYANGWRIDPKGSSSMSVTLEWTPQRWVWRALAISAVVLLGCVAIVVAARLRRRARASGASDDDDDDHHHDDDDDDDDDRAELAVPIGDAGAPLPTVSLFAGTVAVGLGGALLARWWVGVVAAGAFLLAGARPRLRWILAFGAPAALFVAGAFVFVQQLRFGYVPLLEWPAYFVRVHFVGWLAAVLLAADVLLEVLRGVSARRATSKIAEPSHGAT